MSKLIVFNSVSVDGYFVDMNGDMKWAYNPNKDEEWDGFVESNSKGEGVLVFGRITYDLMKSYWPTPAAIKSYPLVAERMNSARKIVFSRTLDKASWNNTTLVKVDMAAEIRKMKNTPKSDMVILGSGSIVSQLTQERLIDEYQIVVIPTMIGGGRTLFEGAERMIKLELKSSRSFANGNVFMRYAPAS
ncbi:MAG: dihydrofolate reductase [Ignavibacteriae bacterium]|nr:MAG: dihydrofolate reductase [Ignavibacteriota bacterium]